MKEHRTLVLTPWYAPHKVISWQRAVTLLYENKAEVVETYDEIVSSPSTSMSVPAVIVLKKHVASTKKGIKFSRLNVLTRDAFKCQYCFRQGSFKELNYDHVVPRVQGGKTVWENIVTSCYACNSKKAGRTPEQAGMKLAVKPFRPRTLPMVVSGYWDHYRNNSLWAPYIDAYSGKNIEGP